MGQFMSETLAHLQSELEYIISKINSTIPTNDPLNIAHGNWSYVGLNKSQLINIAQDISILIESINGEFFEDSDGLLSDYRRRLRFLADSTVPNIWSSAASAVPAYIITLDSLKSEIEKNLTEIMLLILRKLRGG
jgi:hypothetical protein